MPSPKKLCFLVPTYSSGRSTSLFPFLYQTRTLQPQQLSTNQRRTIVGKHNAHRAFCSCSPKRSTAEDEPLHDSDLILKDYIQFDPSERKDPNKPIADNRQKSSLTSSETPLGCHISHDPKSPVEMRFFNLDESDNNDIDESLKQIDLSPDDEIAALFESAIRSQKERDKKREKPAAGKQENPEKAQQKRLKTPPLQPNEHLELILKKLAGAQTDIELWKVLENDVFSLVLALKQDTTTPSPEKTSVRQKKPTQMTIKAAETASNFSPRDLFLLLQQNYSTYCLMATWRLRRAFPTSPYLTQVLPTIKRLGPMSYVLGASTALYNEVLKVKWYHYSDLNGMADLLDEMRNQGVEIDLATVKLAAKVARFREQATSDEQPEKSTRKAWWRLRAVEQGWVRFRESLQEARLVVIQRHADDEFHR